MITKEEFIEQFSALLGQGIEAGFLTVNPSESVESPALDKIDTSFPNLAEAPIPTRRTPEQVKEQFEKALQEGKKESAIHHLLNAGIKFLSGIIP